MADSSVLIYSSTSQNNNTISQLSIFLKILQNSLQKNKTENHEKTAERQTMSYLLGIIILNGNENSIERKNNKNINNLLKKKRINDKKKRKTKGRRLFDNSF